MESVIESVMQKMTLLLNEQAELHEFIRTKAGGVATR